MLDKYRVLECLEHKKDEFKLFNDKQSESITLFREKFETMLTLKREKIVNKLNKLENPGALPGSEWESGKPSIKFPYKWENHEEARNWAHEALLNNTTFAVDGSQIMPSKDFAPPVAAIQVARFENFHSPDGKYTKEIEFEVLSSQELAEAENAYPHIDDYINYKRFEFEINTIIDYIDKPKEREQKPIVFFDGSLILSFISAMGGTGSNKLLRENYLQRISQLFLVSKAHDIPVIGFIDSSSAYDIIDMIKNYYNIDFETSITDARLLDHYLEWGDRSLVFQCQRRHGVLENYGDFKDKIYFTYLKTNKHLPARLEFPEWVYNDRENFEKILNVVRGEIIAGSGYIYSIESADAVAALTTKDRQMFYQIFSDFAYKNRLGLNIAQKAVSKLKRR